jgi:hypothetical protein
MQFATEVQSRPKEDRDFEGIVIPAIRFFTSDPDAVLSSHYRMLALASPRVRRRARLGKRNERRRCSQNAPRTFQSCGAGAAVLVRRRTSLSTPSFLRIAFQEAKAA